MSDPGRRPVGGPWPAALTDVTLDDLAAAIAGYRFGSNERTF